MALPCLKLKSYWFYTTGLTDLEQHKAEKTENPLKAI
jgi:hypothetical protein